MSRIEFLDEDGNVIGTEHVRKIKLPEGKHTAWSQTPRSEIAAYLKCKDTDADVAVLRRDGTVAVNVPGTTAPYLGALLQESTWVTTMTSRDIVDDEVTQWLDRPLGASMPTLPLPCRACDGLHDFAAIDAQQILDGVQAGAKIGRVVI